MRASIHSGGTGIIRHSPRNGFNGCMAYSPRRRIRLATVAGELKGSPHPVGCFEPSPSLTPATGARTTRFDRPRHCRSSCAPLLIAHELPRPAISCAHDIVASTASRLHVRDDRDTPLVDEAGCEKEDTLLIKRKENYFLRGDWTTQITLIRLRKFVFTRARFCAPMSAPSRFNCDHFCSSGKSVDEGEQARDLATPFTLFLVSVRRSDAFRRC